MSFSRGFEWLLPAQPTTRAVDTGEGAVEKGRGDTGDSVSMLRLSTRRLWGVGSAGQGSQEKRHAQVRDGLQVTRQTVTRSGQRLWVLGCSWRWTSGFGGSGRAPAVAGLGNALGMGTCSVVCTRGLGRGGDLGALGILHAMPKCAPRRPDESEAVFGSQTGCTRVLGCGPGDGLATTPLHSCEDDGAGGQGASTQSIMEPDPGSR